MQSAFLVLDLLNNLLCPFCNLKLIKCMKYRLRSELEKVQILLLNLAKKCDLDLKKPFDKIRSVFTLSYAYSLTENTFEQKIKDLILTDILCIRRKVWK